MLCNNILNGAKLKSHFNYHSYLTDVISNAHVTKITNLNIALELNFIRNLTCFLVNLN